MSIPFPDISPIALSLGPLKITWYGLSYALGILGAWRYICLLLRRHPSSSLSIKTFDDFMVWTLLGIILGGRLGYILFYKPFYYFAHPLEIFKTWEGGMSFHGGLLGVIIVSFLFCRSKRIPLLHLLDFLACGAPIGLFLGRIANFINGELSGRPTSLPWSICFPQEDNISRHPSQLYEAFSEGLLLFGILYLCAKSPLAFKRPGFLSGVFLMGYGVFRITCEFFRSPDIHLGLFFENFTWGQILSLPMIFLGLYLFKKSKNSVF